MAEELLDRAQVGPPLEQVGRERVPQPVRVADEPADGARVEPPSAGREEEGVLRAPRERGPGVAQVDGAVVRRLLAERDDPVLPALPPDVDRLAIEVDVGEVEFRELLEELREFGS